MAPPPVDTIASIANLHVRNMPRPSMAMTLSQSAAVISVASPRGMMPALATNTSSRRIDRWLLRSSAARRPRRDVADDRLTSAPPCRN